MRIYLIDCDWDEGVSKTPNPWLMKISSAYKQAGHTVSLVSPNKSNIDMADRIIVSKEKNTNYMPNPSIILNKKTRLIGDFFEGQKETWKMPKSVIQARPDYLLYGTLKKDSFQNSNFMTYVYNGEKIETQDQMRSSYLNVNNIVADRELWSSSDETIIKVLEEIKEVPKIHFLERVDISKLKNENIYNLFKKLSFSTERFNTKILRCSEELEEVGILLNKIKSTRIVPVKPIEIEIYREGDDIAERYFEMIRIIAVALKHRVNISFIELPEDHIYNELVTIFYYYNIKRGSFFDYYIEYETKLKADVALSFLTMREKESIKLVWGIYKKDKELFETGFSSYDGRPSTTRKRMSQGDIEKYYEIFIL